ncbi:MAG: arginine--tRNA ligase [Candidatus Paceibacterota bacterium]
MEQKIKNWIKEILKIEGDFVLAHPKDIKNGDYAFFSSLENEKEALEKLEKNKLAEIEKIEIAGKFINFFLSREFFSQSIEEILNEGNGYGKNELLSGKKIMVEYTDPNPFKPFHIGHLMTNAIGESIARILEHSGALVARANYQGDVGLHVAKAIYGLLDNEKLQNKAGSIALQAGNIGHAYSRGAELYETDEKAKKEIDEINKKLYDKSDEKINEIYKWGFDVTMEAFEDLYKILGTKFDFYFLESAMTDIGKEIVQANIGKIFEKSDGAVIFKAEKFDPKLHTRVFITSQGLPTYETKELGLTKEKFKTEPNMDLSITITANEQMDYMRVVAKALSIIHPDFENRMKHITHGMMRFVGGKMSSRKGNVITGESLMGDVHDMVLEKMTDRNFSPEEQEKIANEVGVAAIKYSILKQSIGGDIIYDFEKSISFEGDSGPYLQYSYTRANSVLEKAQKENILPDFEKVPEEIFELEKLLYKFPEIVSRSASLYEPHHIANYLIEIARSFNSFYGNTVIVSKDDQYSSYKIALTYAFSFVTKTGLHLLGIEAPRKM